MNAPYWEGVAAGCGFLIMLGVIVLAIGCFFISNWHGPGK